MGEDGLWVWEGRTTPLPTLLQAAAWRQNEEAIPRRPGP